MKIGFYSGSFDPFTNGHLHVVKEAAGLFDKVILGIGIHPSKKRRYDKAEMQEAMMNVLKREGLDNVIVIAYDGLTAILAKELGADYLVRGIRNGIDYQYEENMAATSKEISGVDTIYLRGGDLSNVSSSMVVELLRNGVDVSKYLPPEILEVVK